MKRSDLEHILRASAAITGADEFVIIGSQAILGQFPGAPAELTISTEADIFTFRDPHDSVLIDGSIGAGSPFDSTFGYYAHGVGVETAVLPPGWRERLIPVKTPSTGGATGLCLEVHDLAVSKLIAGREKDVDFVRALLKHNLANRATIAARLHAIELNDARKPAAEARLAHL